MIRTAPVLASVLFASGLARAQSSYPYAYFRHIDGTVILQRANELESEDAGVNVPLMPGDRAWTRSGSRAEIEFEGGALLRIDESTKLDFVALGDSRENLIRLWSGSVFLKVADDREIRFRIDTPGASVFPASEGTFRIDVSEGSDLVSLSTFEGVAELASEGGSVLVRSGQRSVARDGVRPEAPFEFNTARWDDFGSWSDSRDRSGARTRRLDGIPEPVERYVGDLDEYGDWRWDTAYGNVWYPTVSVGWSPYSNGRWVYTVYGWTWVPYEPWGWAPHHYGRWGYGSFGWYWMPGSHWGPAWVSWAVGPRWLGWCALGYQDRPIVGYNDLFSRGSSRGGRAVPRGQVHGGWNFTRGDGLSSVSTSRARLRIEDVRDTADQAQVLESGAILDRGLRPRVVGAAAMTRVPRGGIATQPSGPSGPSNPSSQDLGALRRGPAPVYRAPDSDRNRARGEVSTSGTPRVRGREEAPSSTGGESPQPDAAGVGPRPSGNGPPDRTRIPPPSGWDGAVRRREPRERPREDNDGAQRPEPRAIGPYRDPGRSGNESTERESGRARDREPRRERDESDSGSGRVGVRSNGGERSRPPSSPPPDRGSVRSPRSEGGGGGDRPGAVTRKPRER